MLLARFLGASLWSLVNASIGIDNEFDLWMSLWLFLLVYAAFVGYKVIPVYISNYQLQDKMQEEARFAVVNRHSEDQIRDQIYKEVQERWPIGWVVEDGQGRVVGSFENIPLSYEFQGARLIAASAIGNSRSMSQSRRRRSS